MRRFQDVETDLSDFSEINRRSAFHEAGHAAAIYLENRRKNLPLVYFQIQTRSIDAVNAPIFSEISGGRQIGDGLMLPGAAFAEKFSRAELAAYKTAYEADIINFLAGPLAEAKYTLLKQHAKFCIENLGPDNLLSYGGYADLQEVAYYLRCALPTRQAREIALNALFREAFQFVQEFDNWKKISALAEYIVESAEDYICYEQVDAVFKNKSVLTGIF
jgi:hypothetical protein